MPPLKEQLPSALLIPCIVFYKPITIHCPGLKKDLSVAKNGRNKYFKFCLFIAAHAGGIIGPIHMNWSSLSRFKANCTDIKVCRSLSSQQAPRNCLTVVPQCNCVLCLYRRRQWTSPRGGHCSTRGWASPLLKAKVYGEWQSAGSSRCLSLSAVTTA